MVTLNLSATSPAHKQLKDYLEANAGEILAHKINNGVKIIKDGKTLINKKDLIGFVKYATGEAQKQAEKGSTGTFVEDDTVYGWAIHYFEENSIHGTLYNEDGTEYKPPKPVYKPAPASTHIPATPVIPKPKPQVSMFESAEQQTEATADEQDEELTDEPENDADETKTETTSTNYVQINETQFCDADGVVYSKTETEIKKSIPCVIAELGGDAVKVRFV